MANYVCTTDMTLETAISNGSMVNGENLTINAGAVVTCDQTPTILIGNVIINDGKLLVDGINIVADNCINFVGRASYYISPRGRGTFEVKGKWFDIGTTDGTDSQAITVATYWNKGGSAHCIDAIPMIQVETGRRIDFDNTTGTLPEIDDFIWKDTDNTVMGRIVEVNSTGNYIVVKYLTGTLADNDDIYVRKLIDNDGPDLQESWTAKVNNASGDIKEAGIYQEFGNVVSNGVSCIGDMHHGVGGFAFAQIWKSTTITMGSSAGTTGGFVAPSGCNIRIPNVHFSQSDLTSYVLTPPIPWYSGNNEDLRYNVVSSLGGEVDYSICNMGSAFFGSYRGYKFNAEYVGATVGMGNRESGTKTVMAHCVLVNDILDTATGWTWHVYNNIYGASLIDCMGIAGASQTMCYVYRSKDITITGGIFSVCGATSLSSYVNCIAAIQCTDIILNNNIVVSDDGSNNNTIVAINASNNVRCENTYISATQDGLASSKTDVVFAVITGATDIYIAGAQYIGGGLSKGNIINADNATNVKFRCMGLIDDKIYFDPFTSYPVRIAGMGANIDIARMWVDGNASVKGVDIGGTCKDIIISNCSTVYLSDWQPGGSDNVNFRGVHGGAGDPGHWINGIENGYPAMYGRQINDGFRTDALGFITCNFIDPSSTINNTTVIAGNPKFTRDGVINMVSGDILEVEMDYFTMGHEKFTGDFTAVIGSSAWHADEWPNVDVDFQWQLDGGAWNGSWLNARTAANWTAIDSPGYTNIQKGIKIKYRFEATGTQNSVTMFIVDTATSLAIQSANLYPIDQVQCDVVLSNVVVGSRYWVYDVDISAVIEEGTITASPKTITAVVPDATNLKVRVRKSSSSLKYLPYETMAITNTTTINVPIAQVRDTVAEP